MPKKPEWRQLPIEQLVRGRYQPRQHFDPIQLEELAESIKTTGGLLQPVVVRPLPTGKYEIVAGERRWRAIQLAGFTEISCLIGQYNDEQALQASIIENINRANLNPIEEAQAYQRLIDEFDYSHEEIAATIGVKSRVSITNSLRLLKLDSRVKELLIKRELSEGHGKILAGVPSNQQYALAERSVNLHWSVRRLETEVKKLLSAQMNGPFSDPNIKHLETALSEHIGNRVFLEYEEQGGGYMKIRFSNIDELEGHFSRLGFRYT